MSRRQHPRHQTSRIPVELKSRFGVSYGSLVDISAGGAFLRNCKVPDTEAEATFYPGGALPITRKCSVLRDPDGAARGSAVRFATELSASEIGALRAGAGLDPDSDERMKMHLAMRDSEEVNREILNVQSCRSTIFVAMIGGLATAFMAIWRFYASDPGSWDWVGIAAGLSITLALFIIGALSTVEKARAINVRKGFVAALAPYLRGDRVLTGYQGWAQLKTCLEDCGARQDVNVCARRRKRTYRISCRHEGEAMAATLNSSKRLLPGMLDSFTSLSSYLYTFVYAITLAMFAFAMATALRIKLPEKGVDIDPSSFRQLVLGVFLAGILLSTILGRIKKFAAGAFLGFFIVCFAGFILVRTAAGSLFTVILLGFISPLLAGFAFGSLGVFLLQQLYSLRSGKYSVETFFYTWTMVLKFCRPFPDDPSGTPLDSGFRGTMIRFFLNVKSWGDIRPAFITRLKMAEVQESVSVPPAAQAGQDG